MDVLDALLGINHEKNEDIETSKISNLLLDLFAAGTDTTTSDVEWAMAELLRNPEKLNKVQRELQEIFGEGKPVEESDIPQLPYFEAIIKETMRLHPAVPLLLRRLIQMSSSSATLPKNSRVLITVWAIGRDPNYWENPTMFEREKFFGSEIDVKGHNFELIPFCIGCRFCPGLPLALRMVPLMLGSLIHGRKFSNFVPFQFVSEFYCS